MASPEETRAQARKRAREWYVANHEKALAYRRSRDQSGDSHSQKWRQNNPEKNRRYYLKSQYGLTLEQYDSLLNKQCGLCAICRGKEPGRGKFFHVDHDHVTGKVRGLLCQNCNLMIGHALDSAAVLQAAVKYLVGR